uniref:Endolytic peptidoglycan transglycosylase RlpA n=1 Tax=Candidatus Kentrum sp. SD TaxID=2126332 RepID=A0A450YKY0_9GAMM|nr:MAG: rare lipoprotein A [Candidatus Kentron sp. SD]VFK48048.1 MAG: rare lipoprotein A [Candidatus Kentron sp. SD]
MMDFFENRILRRYSLLFALAMAGCGGVPERDGPPSLRCSDNAPDAVPRVEPKSRYGNPRSYVVRGRRYYVSPSNKGYVKRGLASWYGTKFHGRRTSSGEPYDMCAMTAAHRSLPLPTYARVTNLENNRQAVVRINDRGPFYSKRIIDLSYAAARKLRVVGKGTAFVEVRAIDPREFGRANRRPVHPVPKKTNRNRLVASTPRGAAVAPTSSSGNLQLEMEPLPPEGVAVSPAPFKKPVPSQGNLYFQVGAFTTQASAEKLKTELRATIKSDIRVDAAQDGGRTLYKVRLGPFHDPMRADQVGEELGRLGLDRLRVRFDPSR